MDKLMRQKKLHNELLQSVLHGKLPTFWDITPFGRIMNRFTEDMNSIDNKIPNDLGGTVRQIIFVIASILKVIIVTWYFIFITIPMLILYYYVQQYFIPSVRELRRISSIIKSPLYAHFSETLIGTEMIRALNKTNEFKSKNKRLIDNDSQCYYPSMSANRWLSIRLEFIGSTLVCSAALSCIISQPSPGWVGVALSSVMSFASLLNMLMRQKSELEQNIVSVERIDQYIKNIDQEKSFILKENNNDIQRQIANWPQKGEIVFNNVWMKYRDNLDFVFRGLTFTIHSGEHIGIIGRTGSGKSSLFVALLRLVELYENENDKFNNSYIKIDDINISEIGLQDLRSKISVIAQDPILFNATIRKNLDPFNERNDNELIDALKSAHCWDMLKQKVIEYEKNTKSENSNDDVINIESINPLQFKVEANGSNFSMGQRQLLCMARLIGKQSQILLFDEATASIDPATDKLIQQTIRKLFKHNTILTIAHRIETVLDYDKILIMGKGNILQFDTPQNLLADLSQNEFADIIRSSFGADEIEMLFKHENKQNRNV